MGVGVTCERKLVPNAACGVRRRWEADLVDFTDNVLVFLQVEFEHCHKVCSEAVDRHWVTWPARRRGTERAVAISVFSTARTRIKQKPTAAELTETTTLSSGELRVEKAWLQLFQRCQIKAVGQLESGVRVA